MTQLVSETWIDPRDLLAPEGIEPAGTVYRNLGPSALIEAAVQRGQGIVNAAGALQQDTTPYFGRAARSSFYVNDPSIKIGGESLDDLIAWGDPEAGRWDNLPIAAEVFDRLHARVIDHLGSDGDVYIVDAWSGRTSAARMAVRVITTRAPSALFAHNIFIEPTPEEAAAFEPEWTILHAPGVEAAASDGTHGNAFILTHLGRRQTIIGGTRYHGQIKKSIFCVQNFRLPLKGILTMHAGASEGETGAVAIHAGLSGTGKTTLSNTGHPVADDQIVVEIDAVGDAVVSNMEGGQYAKTERLRRDKEPETWDAIRLGTTAENIFLRDDGTPDYDNGSITANGRVGYPLSYVPASKASGTSGPPRNITFLTADGFGVLPPVARLSIEGGMFHFATGFTSKMPGTERGITEPVPTFSSFFGQPFMPLKAHYYTELLARLVRVHGTKIWLVNTGWLGPARSGRGRVDILVSKAIINAVRDGAVDMSEDNFWYDPIFKLHVPRKVPGVPDEVLDPRRAWDDSAAYLQTANRLAEIFQNAADKIDGLNSEVRAAGPAPVSHEGAEGAGARARL